MDGKCKFKQEMSQKDLITDSTHKELKNCFNLCDSLSTSGLY